MKTTDLKKAKLIKECFEHINEIEKHLKFIFNSAAMKTAA